jgi:carboxymethylenebutenolidase
MPHMCFDLDSSPPIPAVAGAAVDGQRTKLQASDGAHFLAFDARAAEPTGAGVVILPDVRGLHHFYEELALRFAERGIDALAIDYFGRTATNDDRGERFEFMPHVDQTRYENVMLDVAAGVDHLRNRGVSSVFTVGFCFGGRLTFLTGAQAELDLAGVIGFYGGPTGPGRAGTPPPIELAKAGQFRAPVLGLFGGADQGIAEAAIDEFGRALTDGGVENELVVFPGAPHSFFDRKAADYADASAEAWAKVIAFIGRHAPVESAAA